MKLIQIDDKTPYVLIAVYGTLLHGGLNHRIFMQGKSEFLGRTTTPALFSMHTCGLFPVLTTGTTQITCEVYKIRSNKVLQDIFRLEGCCGKLDEESHGYKIKQIETKFGEAYIFWLPNFEGSDATLIKSGDWQRRSLPRKNFIHKHIK